jgi:hypothetical protein
MSDGPCWARHPHAALPGLAGQGSDAVPTPPAAMPAPDPASPQSEACDHCGSTDTWWRNCKLLCRGCGAIVKSCADL